MFGVFVCVQWKNVVGVCFSWCLNMLVNVLGLLQFVVSVILMILLLIVSCFIVVSSCVCCCYCLKVMFSLVVKCCWMVFMFIFSVCVQFCSVVLLLGCFCRCWQICCRCGLFGVGRCNGSMFMWCSLFSSRWIMWLLWLFLMCLFLISVVVCSSLCSRGEICIVNGLVGRCKVNDGLMYRLCMCMVVMQFIVCIMLVGIQIVWFDGMIQCLIFDCIIIRLEMVQISWWCWCL